MNSNTGSISSKELREFDIDFNIELDEDIEILYPEAVTGGVLMRRCSGVLYQVTLKHLRWRTILVKCRAFQAVILLESFSIADIFKAI